MDNSNKIVPPHLNAEVYRTDTTGTDTVSYLDYIHLHSDGSALIGCSELTGRYWNGGASVFRDVTEAQKGLKEAKKNFYLTSGTPDGCFVVDSTKLLLCEDSGALSVWATNDDVWKTWSELITVAEHDDAALAVDCLDSGKEYVTVGADGNIKIWDIHEMICLRNYNAAHNRAICGVAVRPNSATSFATASLDQYVTLWDDNIVKPVLDLVTNDCGVRCLKWVTENSVVYGDEAGVLRLVDVRNTGDAHTLAEYPAAVHRLAVQSESQNIAVCCDNKAVTVCNISDISKPKTMYQDKVTHQNYVRCAAWDLKETNVLHTVGWDGELKTHNLS
ncbi:methylosome protein 50-like [Hyposmocoma kahamanoa]|uniref:methylosome protein 50-like n=1 Tax=Hyposmocoma kahamanoa TaxID=1477025 RepID=UPI000E6D7826|nr:methylosome protein 50-like [Hyposmocoma kahamanoa]XP_026329586.1 methylosome protein 50-like [Hyposmocoma kahamanoa]